MLYNEHFKVYDASYEIRHDNNGNAIHMIIKNGEAVIFPSLFDLCDMLFAGSDVERMYVNEEQLELIYELDAYNYYDIKIKINYQ